MMVRPLRALMMFHSLGGAEAHGKPTKASVEDFRTTKHLITVCARWTW